MATKISDMAVTWNASGTTFSAIKMNVTDTASSAASRLLDLQVAAASKFSVAADSLASVRLNNRLTLQNDGTNSGTRIFADGLNGLLVTADAMVVGSTSSFAFASNSWITLPDVFLRRDAADTLAMRRGVNSQAFNIYDTYTDASNFKRLGIGWNAGNVEIITEKSGTGTDSGITLESSAGGRLTAANNGDITGFSAINSDAIFSASGTGELVLGGNPNKTTRGASVILANDTIIMNNIPTSATGLASGQVWNDAGTLKIV